MSHRQMKSNVTDAVNGSFATSLIVATIGGWTIQEWAAFAALVYSVLLILDKLGILPAIKAGVRNACIWAWAKAQGVRNGW